MPQSDKRRDHARILVVDDESSSREGLRKLLAAEGFVVECAGDGQAALALAPTFDPDVVLTDLRMPRLDGIDLCAKLREGDPSLPVILLTVSDDGASLLRGLRAGLTDYLTKPLDIEIVLWTVRRAIGERAKQIEEEQLRAEMKHLYEEARSTAQMYDEVLTTVSHDLRNPLGVIRLCAQQLLKSSEASGEVRSSAETILRSVARSNDLIGSVLDEARARREGVVLARADHGVNDLLADVNDLRALALHRGLQLDIEPIPAERTLFCDRTKIARVLSNLVGNAIKFSPRRGKVRVWAEHDTGETRFAVSDEGSGIAPDARHHVFERFWRSPGSGVPGIGLGLFIAKEIVEAHGGRIWIESEERPGTAVFVAIPRGPSVGKPALPLEDAATAACE